MKINLSGFKSAARFIFTKPIKSDYNKRYKSRRQRNSTKSIAWPVASLAACLVVYAGYTVATCDVASADSMHKTNIKISESLELTEQNSKTEIELQSIYYKGSNPEEENEDITLAVEDTIEVQAVQESQNNTEDDTINTVENMGTTNPIVIQALENTVDTNDNRSDVIESKVGSFTTNKSLSNSDIKQVEPVYSEDGKLLIDSRAEAICLDIRTVSNWTADDFYSILNSEMHSLVPVAIEMEKQLGINAVYIIAVGANETGWGKYMAGNNNYFNWTNDGIDHFDFNSIEEFADFSIDTYRDYYVHEDFYSGKLGFVPSCITPEVVNTKYALNSDGTTNWQWSNTVCDIMSSLSARRTK